MASPPPSQFLVPQAPFRPKSTGANSAGVSSASSSNNPNAHVTSDEGLQERGAPGVVYYKKPIISPSQVQFSQATQLVDITYDQDDQEDEPIAILHGHGPTMGVELLSDKLRYEFGTAKGPKPIVKDTLANDTPANDTLANDTLAKDTLAKDEHHTCDVIINHAHWSKALSVPEIWFVIQVEPDPRDDDSWKFTIEDTSQYGVCLNEKPLLRNTPKLLNWGDVISANSDGLELFRYSFIQKEKPEEENVVVTEKATYRLESKPFGNGNYAQLYRATKSAGGEIYACKVIDRLKKSLSEEEMENIQYEIAILQKVKHENIVKFEACHLTKYKTYIITEYIEGHTILGHGVHHLRNQYFSEIDARRIFVQLCEAVDYLHKRNIVHRDIKSENVMIMPVKNPRTENEDENTVAYKVKLIDFGLARQTDDELTLKSLCGTLSYMAPEVALSNELNGYGKPVDVWSLGVVLFRMLTGLYPFMSESYKTGSTNGNNQTKSPADKNSSKAQEEDVEGDQNSGTNRDILSDYKRNWRVLLNTNSERSDEVRGLFERMFCIDPTRRITIEHVLQHDWMIMIDRELEKFDMAGTAQSTEYSEDGEVIQEWGQLTIIAGCMPDAPRRIKLRKDDEWLGRDTKRVTIPLGNNRLINKIHCKIYRDKKTGDVFVASAVDKGLNGTYVNNLKVEMGRACQLLDGDELGIVVPAENLEDSTRYAVSFRPSLRYKVSVFTAPQTADGDKVMRKIIEHQLDLPAEVKRSRAIYTQVNPKEEDAWGILYPLNDHTKKELLVAPQVNLGRAKGSHIYINDGHISRLHFTLEWDEENSIAQLIVNSSYLRTYVNDVKIRGAYQLRDNDKIVIRTEVIGDPESQNLDKQLFEYGYILKLQDRSRASSSKRVKFEDRDDHNLECNSDPEQTRSFDPENEAD